MTPICRYALLLCGLAFVAPARAADQSLIDAAKKEGELTWYTTLTIDQLARPLADTFEKKYGIKVNVVRTDSAGVALRLHSEMIAGKVFADVVDGSAGTLGLKAEGALMKWLPDSASRLGKNLVDPDGYWTAHQLLVLTPVYNTELVAKADVPKNWDDLLDPKWKGRIVWSSNIATSGGAGFVGLVLAEWGDDKGMAYLRRLAGQKITGLPISGHSVVDEIVSGEYAIALQVFNDTAVYRRRQSAPVDWIPMNPSLAVTSVVSIAARAPHPNAAKLFVDFDVGPEGQVIERDNDYVPADPEIVPLDPEVRPDGTKFRAIYVSPDDVAKGLPNWGQVYSDLFR